MLAKPQKTLIMYLLIVKCYHRSILVYFGFPLNTQSFHTNSTSPYHPYIVIFTVFWHHLRWDI